MNDFHPPSKLDVVIMTAISLEYQAVKKVDDGAYLGSRWDELYHPHTGLPISFRSFIGKDNRPLHIAVAQAGDMGGTDTATTLSPLVEQYRPNYVSMAGVCAGRSGKTGLGDVITADRLFSHDTGKQLRETVLQDLKTYNLRDSWRIAIENFNFLQRFQESEWLKKRPIPFEWQENWVLMKLLFGSSRPWEDTDKSEFCPQWNDVFKHLLNSKYIEILRKNGSLRLTKIGKDYIMPISIQYEGKMPNLSPYGKTLPFRVHVAPMGSGNKVVEDENIWGYISEHMRKTLAIEMEASAVGLVAQRYIKGALVMKGVMDFANHGRDDNFKEFAARASAECLIAILRELVEPKENQESPIVVIPTPIPKPEPRVIPVLEVPPTPSEHESPHDQPLLPTANLVEIAALFSRLLPDDDSFKRTCENTALSPRLFRWEAFPPSDRWLGTFLICAQKNELRQFLGGALSKLPAALRWRVSLSEASLRPLRFDRHTLGQYRASLGYKEGLDIAGLRALREVWGQGDTEFDDLRKYLDEPLAETLSLANAQDNPSGHNGLGENDFGLAAEHFWMWCRTHVGEPFLAWVSKNAAALSPSRLAVIAAALHWWSEGLDMLIAKQTGEPVPDQQTPLATENELKRRCALDWILCEAGATRGGQDDLPSSVRLAIGLGRFDDIAKLLEDSGERRPGVFIDQIAAHANDSNAVVTLALALRRLRIAGLPGEPRDPALRAALHGSLPEATKDDINNLLDQAQQRAWWLKLLAPPFSDAQIEGLIKVYGNAWALPTERDQARQCLCRSHDLLSVWSKFTVEQRLTSEQRRRWIDELTPFELSLIPPLALLPQPTDANERADWNRLSERKNNARQPAV